MEQIWHRPPTVAAAPGEYTTHRAHATRGGVDTLVDSATLEPVPTENLVPPLCTLGIIEDLASAC